MGESESPRMYGQENVNQSYDNTIKDFILKNEDFKPYKSWYWEEDVKYIDKLMEILFPIEDIELKIQKEEQEALEQQVSEAEQEQNESTDEI